MSLLVETTLGIFTIDFFTKEAPQNCLNFLKLASLNYFSFCNFFSVERDFIAICGDRVTSDGTGNGTTIYSLIDPSTNKIFIPDEFNAKLLHSQKGTISLLPSGGGIHRNRSIFFVTLADGLNYLDEKHTVVGRIVEGIEIIDKFNRLLVDTNKRPFDDVIIKRIIVLNDPFPDPDKFSLVKPFHLVPSAEKVKSLRINWMGEIEQEKGLSPEQLKRRNEQRESQSRALTLEILGDIPSHDAAPPENVLFVCKLNPITREEDLQMIFSRFGPVKKCHIVKDKKTASSLGYAFVEFDRKESCEEAYLKMENVMIDERRIHVDFSQSLSKVKNIL